MVKQAFFYAYSWDKEHILVSFDEDFDSEHHVPLGSTMLKLPNGLIPSDEVFSARAFNKKLSVAKRKVTECEVSLEMAKEEVAKLTALPNPLANKRALGDEIVF